ncbi:MAG: hypothetical protein JW891_15775 [Candidatus Lokiarchaeota archaeon]|nr:hypothetical protein [Candidatus Lokiarchaeota archaeon]
MSLNYETDISFINISHGDSTLFEYKPPASFKSFSLDLNVIKQNKINDIFFHLNRGNSKIVYIRKDNLVYSIATEVEKIQFQVLEAIIEQVIKEFNATFEIDIILSYSTISPSIFTAFKDEVVKILVDFDSLELIKKVAVFCRICDTTHFIHVKRSFIDNKDAYPIPLVYTHLGHSIMCYIDKNYQVRGVELVHITG